MGTDNPVAHFGWPAKFNSDIPFSSVRAETDFRAIDFDSVVWFNEDFAEMSRRVYDESVGNLDPGKEAIFPSVHNALIGADGETWFAKIMVRPAWTEFRCADHLEKALSRILKYNSGINSFMVYDATRGVWVSEKDTFSWGSTVGSSIDSIINEFGMALSRAADLVERLGDNIAPHPGPKPVSTDNQNLKDAHSAADFKRKKMLEKVERIRKMSRDIFQGKYAPIKKLLKDRLSIDQIAWDSDTEWLILKDGAVNVEEIYRTHEIQPYGFSPEHMMTMALDVGLGDAQESSAETHWDHGVAKVLPDPEVRRYLQKRFGAALLGQPGLAGKSMVWQWGVGDTAKSTIQECIAGSRGVFAPYSVTSSANALTKTGERTGAGERFKAYARGKRYAIMSELDDGEQLAQGDLKVMTGGETVEGTAKYSNAVNYFFTATIFMASNHPPLFPPGDTAARTRIHVVPFTHKLFIRSKDPKGWAQAPESHRADEGWANKVLTSPKERAAILRWVLDGLVFFGRDGLGDLPEAMKEAAEEFAADADPVSKIVYTLIGTEPGYEDNPYLRIFSDAEWSAYGYLERDGLTTTQLETLVELRANELRLLKQGDRVPRKWMNGAKSMLHELGGKKKKIKTDAGNTAYGYSRVKLQYAPYGVEDFIKMPGVGK